MFGTFFIPQQRLGFPSTPLASYISPPPQLSPLLCSVSVRLRPLNNTERERGIGWRIGDDGTSLVDHTVSPPLLLHDAAPAAPASTSTTASPTPYHVDRVFDGNYTTRDIYDMCARNVIDGSLAGFHGTIFAYGQTSSGKTHTMRGTPHEPGIIPLAVHDIFARIAADQTRRYEVRVSFLEIYNEEIIDLLANPSTHPPRLSVQESKEAGVVVVGLAEESVDGAVAAMTHIAEGEARRKVGATQMNAHSSRSHTLFRMTIESTPVLIPTATTNHTNVQDKETVAPPRTTMTTTAATAAPTSAHAHASVWVSTLTLVDLAGSERLGKTGAEGVRKKEGAAINTSLMILGNVIHKLAEGGAGHIPYRDSKLTHILKTSLGGTARTAVICNVTPALCHMDETHSTLRFACRAKKVANHVARNERVADATTIKRQQVEIDRLKSTIRSLKRQQQQKKNGNNKENDNNNDDDDDNDNDDDDDEVKQLKATIATLEAETKHLRATQDPLARFQDALEQQGDRKEMEEQDDDDDDKDEEGNHHHHPYLDEHDEPLGMRGRHGRRRRRRRQTVGAVSSTAPDRAWKRARVEVSVATTTAVAAAEAVLAQVQQERDRAVKEREEAKWNVRVMEKRVKDLTECRHATQRTHEGDHPCHHHHGSLGDGDGEKEEGAYGPHGGHEEGAVSSSSKVETLQAELDLLRAESLRAARDAAESRDVCVRTQQGAARDVAHAHARAARAEEAQSAAEQHAQSLEGKVTSLRSQLEATVSEKETAEEARRSLQERLTESLDENARLTRHCEELESRKRAPLYQYKQEAELRAATEKTNEAVARALAAELTAKEATRAREIAELALEEAREAATRAEQQLTTTLQIRHAEWEERVHTLEHQAADAERARETHAAAAAEAEARVENLTARVAHLREEVTLAEKDASESQTRVRVVEEEMTEVQACLDAAAARAQSLEDDLERTTKEVQEIQAQLEEAQVKP